jgi:hypothetical protein
MNMIFTSKKNTKTIQELSTQNSHRIKTVENTTDFRKNTQFFHLGMISRIQNTGKCASCGEK